MRSHLRRCPHRRHRLTLELLESRCLLNGSPGLMVTTDQDVVDATDGLTSLREAIANAAGSAGPDTVTFDPAFFATPRAITLDPARGGLVLDSAVTVQGPAGGVTVARSTAAGTPEFRLVWVNSGVTVELRSLTLTGGQADMGGGIQNVGTLTVSNCTFSGNSATAGGGGGIVNWGPLAVNDCTFSGNSATDGGGIMSEDALLTVSNCTFSGNSATAGWGGGIRDLSSGTLAVSNCTFSGNSATRMGGGIAHVGGTATLAVSNCTFSGNSALDGGGIYSSGPLTVSSCTFSGNSATRWGGGIGGWNTLAVSDCTFSGNSALDGGGIRSSGFVTVTQCTLSGNSATGGNGGGIYFSGGVLTVSNSTLSGNSATAGGGLFFDGDHGGTVTLNNSLGDCPFLGSRLFCQLESADWPRGCSPPPPASVTLVPRLAPP